MELLYKVILLLTVLGGVHTKPYTTGLETELRSNLFTDYDPLQRPSENVNVFVALNLFTINSLDIKTQTLSTSAYFDLFWLDARLAWKGNSNYTNIKFIFSSETFMWRPAIVIENGVSNLNILSDPNTLMRVQSVGTTTWNPGGIFKTHCEADVTYYPLDTQTCSIVISTWGYTAQEVMLILDQDEPIGMTEFKENGEWEVVETRTTAETQLKKDNSFNRLHFTVVLRRRPLFHILNTIFPVILMAILIVFVFKLPPESGERVGMSLTVLLAYAVYLSLISENIPQTSLSASILSTYLTIILMLSALSVVFTIVVLDIYFNHEDDEDIPHWVQILTRKVLVRVSMWKGHRCCGRKDKVAPDDEMCTQNGDVMKKIAPFQDTADQPIGEEKNDRPKIYSWQEIALILDKCFMMLFVAMILIATAGCFGILIAQYQSNSG